VELLTLNQLELLKTDIDRAINDLDIPTKKSKLGELETLSLEETFWSDNNRARKIMTEIEVLRDEISTSEYLVETVNSLLELFQTTSEDQRDELLSEFTKLNNDFSEFKKYKFLSGKYDKSDAVLSIHAGQGGTEATDWTAILYRMYKRLAERKGWKIDVDHEVPGTETGYSTVTITISGKYAYGFLKHEAGTHRLVRISPFNSANLRQTTFAGVEVMPVIDEEAAIEIPDSDIEFKAVRSGGPGGQSVNKTSSAVQIRHIPTGLSVHCSIQRSQTQNRETAMQMLKAKLWRLDQDKKDAEVRELKGEHKIAGWGNQIRNYVLHPYKLVKDLRTNVESTNPEAVLDGELDEFLEAQLLLNS
jgi:peptide chain release factor 2